MAAFNFPNSPSTNDIHNENGVSWKWNGAVWKKIGTVANTFDQINVVGVSTFGGNLSIADKIIHTGDTNTAIRFSGADTITAETGGSERLRIDSEGKFWSDRTVSSTSGNHPCLDIETHSSGSEDSTFSTGIDFRVDGVHKKRLVVTRGSTASTVGGGDWIFYRDNGTDEGFRLNHQGQSTFTANNSSGYAARFIQAHASNPAFIEINSPNDNNLRPSYIQLKNNGTNKWGIGQVYQSTSSGAFHIAAGAHSQNNSKFTITTSGNVGIGTVNPDVFHSSAYNLVVGNGQGEEGITIYSGSSGGVINFADANSGDARFRGRIIYNHSDNSLRLNTAGSERLRISSSGNMGLGDLSNVSNNPQALLHIANTSPTFRIQDTTHDFYGHISADDGGNLSFDSDAGNGAGSSHMTFKTDGSEKLRITNTGDVCIGATAPVSAEKLYLLNGSAISGRSIDPLTTVLFEDAECRLQLQSDNTGSNASTLILSNDNKHWMVQQRATNASNRFQIGYVAGTATDLSNQSSNYFVIDTSGDIGLGGITSPLWTTGGGIHLNDNYFIGFGNGGSGRPDFQIGTTGGASLDFRCGFGGDTADIQISTSGKLTVSSDSEPQVDVQASSSAGASMRVQSAGQYAYHMIVGSQRNWRLGLPTGGTTFAIRDQTGGYNVLECNTIRSTKFLGSGTDVEIFPTDGMINYGMDGRNSYVTSTNGCYIFSGSGSSDGSTDLPAGTLVLQSRSNVDRDIVFATGSSPSEKLRIRRDGKIWKQSNQIYPVLKVQTITTNGSASLSGSGSWQTMHTLTIDPIKSGSKLWCHWQIQTWWGSTSDGAGDIYVKMDENSSGSWSTFFQNDRIAGNFDSDERRHHNTIDLVDTFPCSTASSFNIRLQAYASGSMGSANFNFFHTSSGNFFHFMEFDVA